MQNRKYFTFQCSVNDNVTLEADNREQTDPRCHQINWKHDFQGQALAGCMSVTQP